MSNVIKPEKMDQVVFDKLIACNLDPAIKNEFLANCYHCSDEKDVKVNFDDACKKYKFSGREIEFSEFSFLGHVKCFDSFADVYREKLKWSPKHFEEMFASDDPGAERVARRRIAAFFASIKTWDTKPRLSRGNPWLFAGGEKSPFEIRGVSRKCIPALLAHSSYGTRLKFIGFIVQRALAGILREPTIADAEYKYAKSIWYPGGRSKPLSHCSECNGKDGFREGIADGHAVLMTNMEQTFVSMNV